MSLQSIIDDMDTIGAQLQRELTDAGRNYDVMALALKNLRLARNALDQIAEDAGLPNEEWWDDFRGRVRDMKGIV